MGRLAEIIVLDQFSRNIYRGSAKAYQCDLQAQILTQEAIRVGADQRLDKARRPFIYMPLMHSENIELQTLSVEMFGLLGNPSQHEFAIKHRDIIAEFGRFPHRNNELGRVSCSRELEFLKQPGSSF